MGNGKKFEKARSAIVQLVLYAIVIGAILLPFYLVWRFVSSICMLSKEKRKLKGDKCIWLSDENKQDYGEYLNYLVRIDSDHNCMKEKIVALDALIESQHVKATEMAIRKNSDGSYSRRSNLGQLIRNEIDGLEQSKFFFLRKIESLNVEKLKIEHRINTLERNPLKQWSKINSLCSKKEKYEISILAWMAGFYFYFFSYRETGLLDLFPMMFVPALCVGLMIYVFSCFNKNPARSYYSKPGLVTKDVIDVGLYVLPKRRNYWRLAVILFLLACCHFSAKYGKEYGRSIVKENQLQELEIKRQEFGRERRAARIAEKKKAKDLLEQDFINANASQ